MIDSYALSLESPSPEKVPPKARLPLVLAAFLALAIGLASAGLLIAFEIDEPSILVAAGLASAAAAILYAAAVRRSLRARLRRFDASPAPTWIMVSLAPLTAVFGWLLSLAFAPGRPDGLALAVVAFIGMDVVLLAALILAWQVRGFHHQAAARFPAEFQLEPVPRADLPMAVRTFFDERSLLLESMRFRKLEDYRRGEPTWQFSRVFASENREIMAELACAFPSGGDHGVFVCSFLSLFEDGGFLETTDLPLPAPLDDGPVHLRSVPNADLQPLLERHRHFAQQLAASRNAPILPIPPGRHRPALTFAADQARRAGRRTAAVRE
jgi:hypothetical protein